MPVLMTGKWGTEVTAGAEPSVLAAFPLARGSPERAPSVGLGVMEEANPTREDGPMALQALLKYFRGGAVPYRKHGEPSLLPA